MHDQAWRLKSQPWGISARASHYAITPQRQDKHACTILKRGGASCNAQTPRHPTPAARKAAVFAASAAMGTRLSGLTSVL